MSQAKQQITTALEALYGQGTDSATKSNANAFLLEFQRSKDAWGLIFPAFETTDDNVNANYKLFMAQTLRSKIQYDFGQLPLESIESLRNSVLQLIINVQSTGNSLIIRQCSIALAYLMLQDFSWNNPLPQVIELLSNPASIPTLLEFLRILPEEMTEVEKTPLTNEEFEAQTQNLLINNIERVLYILNELAGSSHSSETDMAILNCLKSWLFELEITEILKRFKNLWPIIVKGFADEETFDTAVDCLITIITEIDIYSDDKSYMDLVHLIYNHLINLSLFIQENWEDSLIIERLTELYSITMETWHILIVKDPPSFEKLMEIILKLTSYPDDLDIVKYTFKGWSDLKSMLVLSPYKNSRELFKPIYLKLANILIDHLRYPKTSQSTDISILFNGNKEAEDKFKDSRYEIGDTLKDCCSVAGSYATLNIPFEKLQVLINLTPIEQIQWQDVEALLFSIRSMAKEVSNNENKILPQIMNYLLQLPENPKIRYAAILVLGRYTLWTSRHPEFLEMELDYISKGFQVVNSQYTVNDKRDIIIASSHALKYFCIDCCDLLINYLPALYQLYKNIENEIDIQSIYDISEGISHVINKSIIKNDQNDEIYEILKMFWLTTLTKSNDYLSYNEITEAQSAQIADNIEILTIYIENLKPRNIDSKTNKVANLIMDSVLPLVIKLIEKFGKAAKVSERSLKLIRRSIQTFKEYLLPKLEEIANLLILGYKQFEMGCYLWVSGALINEYCDEQQFPPEILNSMWSFSKTQIEAFLITFNTQNKNELSTLCDDFFRMMRDVLMFQPLNLLENDELLNNLLDISLISLELYNEDDTLTTIFNFLVDLLMWGDESPPVSFIADLPIPLKLKIHSIVNVKGEILIKKLMYWEIYKFTYDVQHDCLELIVQIIKLSIFNGANSKISLNWLNEFLNSLPSNFINDSEKIKLLKTIENAIESRNFRKVRSGINDFVGWYKRKMVSRNYE